MKRWFATAAIAALCVTSLRADVTITTITTIQGGAVGMVGGMSPEMTMRIKGTKARNDVDVAGHKVTTIIDLETKQVIMLRHAEKIAQIVSSPDQAPPMPKLDGSFKPTGQSKVIEGVNCDEFTFKMTVNMAEMGGPQMPPEAAAMMKDLRMLTSGSIWIAKNAPGTGDYMAFQKAAAKSGLGPLASGGVPGMQAGGMDQIMKVVADAPGVPYLTEATMTVEGSGQIVEIMKQLGSMKISSKVTKISVDAVPDDLFQIPADYKTTK